MYELMVPQSFMQPCVVCLLNDYRGVLRPTWDYYALIWLFLHQHSTTHLLHLNTVAFTVCCFLVLWYPFMKGLTQLYLITFLVHGHYDVLPPPLLVGYCFRCCLSVCLSSCLLVSTMVWVDFVKFLELVDYWSEKSLLNFRNDSYRYSGYFSVSILTQYIVVSRFEKWKWSWENQFQRSAGKCTSMYLLLAGNDTVSISLWHGRGMHCTELRLAIMLISYYVLSI